MGPLSHYSRFVRIMKVALPALAAVLLGLVVVWPKLSLDDKRFPVGFAKLPTTKEVETLAMRNARYYGLDESNRPYAVTSDMATQVPGNSDLIHLDAPKADFTSSSGANVLVDGAKGLYHQSTKTLDLSGGVNLFHDAGYELHTETATLNLANNSARGTDPVSGFGPQGAIRSAGFEMAGKGHTITFTGKSQLTVMGASPKGRDKGGKRR
jgi:lipopolysaccharide export system protein LptC